MQHQPYTNKQPSPTKLVFCILLDGIGCFSYALPFLGEIGDFLWAPLSALLLYQMFPGVIGTKAAWLELIEELLPFTDIVPTFTVTWLYERYCK